MLTDYRPTQHPYRQPVSIDAVPLAKCLRWGVPCLAIGLFVVDLMFLALGDSDGATKALRRPDLAT